MNEWAIESFLKTNDRVVIVGTQGRSMSSLPVEYLMATLAQNQRRIVACDAESR